MKGMSQWNNRFQLLKDEADEIDLSEQAESSGPVETMSNPIPLTPAAGSSYSLHSVSVLPPKIFLRSARVKVSTQITVQLQTLDTGEKITVTALLDSGATGMFLDSKWVLANNLNTRRLPRPIPVYNVDGTLNQGGSISEELDLNMIYQGHREKATFAVCDLGDKPAIIGHTWLFRHNPEINWQNGEVIFSRCPPHCNVERSKVKFERPNKLPRRVGTTRDLVPVLPPHDGEVDFVSAGQSPDFFSSHGILAIDGHSGHSMTCEFAKGDRLFMTVVGDSRHVRAVATPSQQMAEGYLRAEAAHHRSFEEVVPLQYQMFRDVFDKESFDQLPHRKPWDHAIELKPGAEPFRSKIYPLSPVEQKELDAFLDENLRSGRIQYSKSPMASPVFFVKKKDGSLRLVQDYRKLNDMTIKNSYPLPLISDIVGKLKLARWFTKLDVRWGYNNVRIKEGDEWKAAFRTNRGLFEPLVMFFGLTNSPATFQTMMNALFKDLIDEGVVIVYIDDILIFTEDLELHRKVVKRVLGILRDSGLYLKAEKCDFEQKQVEYLGLIISHGQMAMDPVKIEGVSNWPVPTCVKDVQSFLGFVNFYRRFILDFAGIARPLHDLTRKDKVWTWDREHEVAFEALKLRITSAPVLVFPDDTKPFKVEADSSNYATGSVLSQLGEDGKWHPCGFQSKSLNAVERNYDTHDKEMLAIIRALEEWRHHLEGTQHVFEIWTDHKNLEYFMSAKKLNRRQARWSLFLSRFDFTLHHRPGSKSLKPDALSRRPDHGKGQNDNDNVVLLKPSFFQVHALNHDHVVLTGEEQGLLQRIKDSRDYDEPVAKALELLKRSGQRSLAGEEWSQEDNLILFRGKVYVPKDMNLRRQIVQLHHDSPVVGHPGRWKTLELVSRNYWWPGISRYVGNYVKSCDRCNRTKTFPAKPSGALVPNQIPKGIWEIITVDLITGLPESQGFNAIMVTVDRLSKLVHVIPTNDTVTAEGIARLFRDHVWKHHGLPHQIISDRGPQFVSNFMRELNRLLGIQTTPSTAYHPQTDGQTERVNQEIEQYLRVFVNHRQDDWAEWLPLAEFCHNNRVQASTRQSPFMLNTGRDPRLGTEPLRDVRVESAANFVKRMKSARKEAEAALHKAADDMARYYDRNRQHSVDYQVGDRVWLEGKDIQTDRPSKKLDDKRYGPFMITEVIGPNAYKLDLPASMKIHPVFNTVKLRPFIPDPIPGRNPNPRPPPLIESNEPEWEIEMIKDSKLVRGRLHFLIKWRGYPHEESTWEPADNLNNADHLVRDFYARHPSAPRRINAVQFSALQFHTYENLTTPRLPFNFPTWTEGRL